VTAPQGLRAPALRTGLAAAGVLALVLALAASQLAPANPWRPAVLGPTLVLGAGAVAAGWALQGVPRLRQDGQLWASGGLLLLVGGVGGGGWGAAALADRFALVALVCVLPLAVVAFPGPMPAPVRRVAVPVLLAGGVLAAVRGWRSPELGVLGLVVATTLAAAVWWRFEWGLTERRAGPDRDALRWLTLGLATALLVTIPLSFTALEPVIGVGASLAALMVTVSVVLGGRPPAGVDIRAAVASSAGLLLTLLVTFALFAGAVSVFEAAGAPLRSVGPLSLVAMAVAAAFGPVRRLVERAVELLLFGDRLDPVGAASRFAAELSAADDPVAALRELRSLLNLPYAAVRDVEDRPLVESGRTAPDGTFALPLSAAGVLVGSLLLGLRPGETGPSARDRPVLKIVVPALAQAVRARALTAQVAESRRRVVTAVEEDRRRLRRDLHDGLGPTLTGVAYATDAARNVVRTDPALAEQLLAGAREDTGTAIAEVRQLVDGLRPAVLDQLGLRAALEQHAAQLRGRNGDRIVVDVAVADLPELTAATEVTVFRIVTEALTNVARHSGSATARLEIAPDADGQLVVQVSDAGACAAEQPSWEPGVGLQSMRERVDQLGGVLTVGADDRGGHVRARLPLTPVTSALA
jgi:two-component system NarL family sensor kinase